MKNYSRKWFPWGVWLKGVLLESFLFLAAYILWVILRAAQAPSRLLIGSLAVLIPVVTAVVLVFWSLPRLPDFSRNAWRFLGLGLVCWSLGAAIRTFYEAVCGVPAPTFSTADIFNIISYPLFFTALVLYPFENRYAPSFFRFLLDAAISAGAVATLGWLILDRPVSFTRPADLVPLIYPIIDLILLMILVNVLLANRKARRTQILWGIGLLFFLLSDYIYSLLAPANGYQAGGLESLGWMMGSLVFGCGAVFAIEYPIRQNCENSVTFDIGMRLQNVLPITLVLALLWFILADWRISGELLLPGLWMCLLLTLMLIVRMGVHAGEIELYKYWQLVNSVTEPTFICDGRGKILLGNPALARTLDFREGNQVPGESLAAVFDSRTLPADLLQRAIRGGCSLEVSHRVHGTPYLLSLSPIFSEGRKVLLAGMAHDLSDQKRQQAVIQNALDEMQAANRRVEELNVNLEQKVEERTRTLSEAYQRLEEQNKVLQALDQLKSDFVSMVSHELRTPLTSLNGGLELLLNRQDRSVSDQTTLVLMQGEIQRLTRFVESILDLSAMEAGRIHLHPLPLSLAAVLENILRQFNTVPGAQRIQVHLPSGLPLVQADEEALLSVFHHLLDNALKYAPEGPIVIDAVCTRGKLRIRVTDSGPGIPKGKRSFLFERFQRLDISDAQSVYGYGLGLYFSRYFLRAMHSDLVFEAPPEGGARFCFDLKMVR